MSSRVTRRSQRLAFRTGIKILQFYLLMVVIILPSLWVLVYKFALPHTTNEVKKHKEELTTIGVRQGIPALIEEIGKRENESDDDDEDILAFLLVDKDRQYLAGNPPFWLEFRYSREIQEHEHHHREHGEESLEHGIQEAEDFISVSVTFEGGEQLFIFHSLEVADHLLDDLPPAIVLAFILTSIGSLITMLYLSSQIYKRIAVLNYAAEEFKKGRHYTRAQLTGNGDEFDELAGNLNDMFSSTEQHVKSLKRMGVDLAHDLRSHLTRIKTRLEVTALSERGEVDYQAVLVETTENFGKLVDMFDSMLLISRIEGGSGIELQPGLDIIKELGTLLTLYEGCDREVTLRVESDIPQLLCNREILLRAISNVVDNALKFAENPGPIEIVIDQDKGRTKIAIQDPGPGIPEDKMDELLLRFTRLDKSRSSPGYGLGLALVKAASDFHRAELKFVRLDPGFSVEFTFPAPS